MSALITLDHLSATTPEARPLFSDLSASIATERVGVVGPNGCGKSTLLRILAGQAQPAEGSVTLAGRVGFLDQALNRDVRSWAQMLGIAADWARLERIEAGAGTETDFEQAEWSLEARLDATLRQVGLPRRPLDEDPHELSGGERMRLALAGLILAAPDILLLDEPTNNLDAAGRALITDVIATWPGAVILASHDRALLDGVDHILSLRPSACQMTPGGWSVFEAEQSARLEQAQRERELAIAALKKMEGAAQQRQERKARSDSQGRKARRDGSQSKLLLNAERERAQGTDARAMAMGQKQIAAAQARVSAAQEAVDVLTPVHMDLPDCRLGSREKLVALRGVSAVRGGRVLFEGLDLEIAGPDRVRIIGANGTGKSTLLAIAAGRVAPDCGEAWQKPDSLAMLDQHVEMLDPARSILANCCALNPHLSAHEARARLARFAFRNRAAERAVGVLSGGERLRAGLAIALNAQTAPQMLILDEPTNHLDLDSIALLERALNAFCGAILMVSHDAVFCERIGITRRVCLA